MKKYFFILCFFYIPLSFSQNKADDIVGYYLTIDPFSGEKSQSFIYKTKQGTYTGVVCWVENQEKKHFLNYIFLRNLRYDSVTNDWVDGKITYPNRKGTYHVNMQFEDTNKLKVRAYLGLSMLGKTMYWQKEKSKRIQK